MRRGSLHVFREGMKGPAVRGLKTEEEKMRVISAIELFQRSENELSALFQSVSGELVKTERESPERRNALASLENIARARVCVMARP
jgi:hypothetical protein